jgi:regulator of protease activity HflC (stomatin/prohibitin superfamily)
LVDEVVTIPVGETRTISSTTGWYYMTAEEELAGGKDPNSASSILAPGVDGYTLTGDGNIVHVRATVNYRITDPLQYAFAFAGQTNLLEHFLDNAIFYASARFDADDALYRNRAGFREAVVNRFRDLIAQVQLGVEIDPREVRIDPPLTVQRAFNDVLDSQQRQDIRVREAEAYARNATNRAIGEASVIVQNGLTRSNTFVQSVATDATNFQGLLPAWKESPQLLHDRLLAQSMEKVLTNAEFKAYLPARPDGRPRELRLQLNKEIPVPTRAESRTAAQP